MAISDTTSAPRSRDRCAELPLPRVPSRSVNPRLARVALSAGTVPKSIPVSSVRPATQSNAGPSNASVT